MSHYKRDLPSDGIALTGLHRYSMNAEDAEHIKKVKKLTNCGYQSCEIVCILSLIILYLLCPCPNSFDKYLNNNFKRWNQGPKRSYSLVLFFSLVAWNVKTWNWWFVDFPPPHIAADIATRSDVLLWWEIRSHLNADLAEVYKYKYVYNIQWDIMENWREGRRVHVYLYLYWQQCRNWDLLPQPSTPFHLLVI